MSYAELPCKLAVTRVTDYLDGALSVEDRAALERHLAWCEWCMTYFDQLRDTVRATRSLRGEDVAAPVDDLLAAFRNSRGGASQS
jgi:anti-sigma factor RsiW